MGPDTPIRDIVDSLVPRVGESCRGHGQLGRWPRPGISSGDLLGGVGQSVTGCIEGIGCVGPNQETVIADADTVAAEGDSHSIGS